MMDDKIVLFAEAAIREYLAQRPESADTLEGIHLLWIHWQGLPESPVVTAAALERLEAAGVMERRPIRATPSGAGLVRADGARCLRDSFRRPRHSVYFGWGHVSLPFLR